MIRVGDTVKVTNMNLDLNSEDTEEYGKLDGAVGKVVDLNSGFKCPVCVRFEKEWKPADEVWFKENELSVAIWQEQHLGELEEASKNG